MWPSADPTFLEGVIEASVGAVLFPLAFHTLKDAISDHYVALARGIMDLRPHPKFFVRICSRIAIKFLPRSKQKPSVAADVACKTVSSLFAVMTTMVGFFVFSTCGSEVMSERRPLVRHYLCFGLSYFIYDVYAMFVVHREKGNVKVGSTVYESFWNESWLLIIHHLLLPLVLYPLLTVYEAALGDCLIGLAFMMEASTPFVSARAILELLGMKRSTPYVVNGIAMLVVFLLCRVLLMPYTYYLYGQQIGASTLDTVLYHVPKVCTSFMLFFFVMQLYWFGLMVRGAAKMLTSQKAEKSS